MKWSDWPNAPTGDRAVKQSLPDDFLTIDGPSFQNQSMLPVLIVPRPVLAQPSVPVSVVGKTAPSVTLRRLSRLAQNPTIVRMSRPLTPLPLSTICEIPGEDMSPSPAKRIRFNSGVGIPYPPLSPMRGNFAATCALSPIVQRLSERLLPLVQEIASSLGALQAGKSGMQTRSQARAEIAEPAGMKTRSQTAKAISVAQMPTPMLTSNDIHSAIDKSSDQHKDTEFVFDVSILSNPKEPKGIQEALRSKEGHEWRKSARQEFQNFLDQSSWIVTSREEVAKHGKTIIGSKWVFKKKLKANGRVRFKSRIVSKGYQQVPGVDYTEKFAPVANDTTTRLILAVTL